MAAITFDKLNKVYHGSPNFHAIRDVDLDIAPGEFVVFVGPSGCGKSTLLRMVAGLEEVTAGEIRFDGDVVNDLTPRERGIGMVFQSYALYPHMSVFDNMAFGLKRAGRDKAEIAEVVRKVAETLQIDQFLDRKPAALSGGQRQRVAIGRAIVRQPRVFLFDEPLSNLDAALRIQMRVEIAKIHQRLSATMIYVTHDQAEAMTLADKIVVLNQGRVAQCGSPLEIYNHPADIFVAGFIGSPQMNFLSVSGSDDEVSLADGNRAAVKGLRGPGTLGVRPEHFRLDGSLADVSIEGNILVIEQLGNETLVYVEADVSEQPVVVSLDASTRVSTGESLTLYAMAKDCHLFDETGTALSAG